ncbi:hypothetical protein OAR33_00780, partial [bacterium]|nr:hypothetical protein [bacterium]
MTKPSLILVASICWNVGCAPKSDPTKTAFEDPAFIRRDGTPLEPPRPREFDERTRPLTIEVPPAEAEPPVPPESDAMPERREDVDSEASERSESSDAPTGAVGTVGQNGVPGDGRS